MTELLIWIAGGIFTLGAFVAGWISRALYHRGQHRQQLGIRVCVVCGEPVKKGTIRQADGSIKHPWCKGAA